MIFRDSAIVACNFVVLSLKFLTLSNFEKILKETKILHLQANIEISFKFCLHKINKESRKFAFMYSVHHSDPKINKRIKSTAIKYTKKQMSNMLH